MTSEPQTDREPNAVELPAPTVWPVVLGLGILLLAAGVAMSLVFAVVGLVIFAAGLAGWIAQLLPGQGHVHESRVEPDQRPRPVEGAPGTVAQLESGMAGFRLQLPTKFHPISAGLKGGIAGGVLMPLPALAYGVLSGNGLWFPVNLLAGMVLPGMQDRPIEELKQFSLVWLVVALLIHAAISVVMGLMYGVLLPTLPQVPGGQIIWGGLFLPMIWTAGSYGMMGVVNPALQEHVEWPWFVVSQFVFGLTAAMVVIRSEKVVVPPVGPGPASAAALSAVRSGEGQP